MTRRLDSEIRSRARRLGRRGRGGGFTLIELMVVISIIALAAALVLPTVSRLFSASADEQARSMLGAMLAGVRATAIENACYTAVHVQMGKDGKCWAIALIGEGQGATTLFGPMEGSVPRQMPGGVAFGGISGEFVSGRDYIAAKLGDLDDFTNFTVAFGPDGAVVTDIAGAALRLENNQNLFGASEQAVWQTCPAPEVGVRAVTYFPYSELKVRSTAERVGYLDKNGQFICLSFLTGRLMEAQ